MRVMNSFRKTQGYIFATLLMLTTVTLISVGVFDLYANVALYVNLFFVLLGLLFCDNIVADKYIYLCFVAIYLFFSIFINGGGIGSVLTFVIPLFMLLSFCDLAFSGGTKKLLTVFGVFVILLLFLYSFPYGSNYQQYALTKINPNTLGMFMMFFCMLICVLNELTTKRGKIGVALLFVLSVWGMYNYQSRGTTIALFGFFLLLILPDRFFGKKRVLALVLTLILVGTLFPFIYLHLYNTGYSLEMFGKPLYTGREELWLNMFTLLKNNTVAFVFGMGSQTVLWENDLNVHNNFFNIIVNFGMIGYALYYIFILSYITKLAKYIQQKTVRKPLLMFVCAVLLLGFSETTSLWSVIFPFAYFGLIVANSKYAGVEKKSAVCLQHDAGKKEVSAE